MDFRCEKIDNWCLICGRCHQNEDGIRDEEIQSSGSSPISSSVKLLTAYILQNSLLSSNERDRGRDKIQSEILSSFKDGKCSICLECLSRAGKLQGLHLELEKVQMQILDVLRNLQHYLKFSMVTQKGRNDDDDVMITRFQDVLQREFMSLDLLDGSFVRLERLRSAGYKNKSSFILVSEKAQSPKKVPKKTEELRLRLKRKSSFSESVLMEQVIHRDLSGKVFGRIAGKEDEEEVTNGGGTDDDHDADNQNESHDDINPLHILPKLEKVIPSDNDDDDDDDYHPEDNRDSVSDVGHQDHDEEDSEEEVVNPLDNMTEAQKRRFKGTHRDCDICLEMIPSKDMKSHLQTHPEFERFYECDICPPHSKKRIYGTYKGLVWHHLRAKHKVQLPCLLCPDQSILFFRSELCRHLYEFHQLSHKKLPCKFNGCSEEFYDHVTRQSHYDYEHCGTSFACAKCQKTFKSEGYLHSHEKTHEEGYIPGKAKCSYCSKMILKIHLDHHILSVHSVEVKGEFICELCRTRPKFKSKSRLQWHIGRIHGQEGEGITFICDSCPKEFKTKEGLWGHRKSYHEEPDMVMCSHCPKSFQRHKLADHVRKVHGEKKKMPEVRLPCQYCPKTFTHPSNRKAHEENHKNERKYKCEEPECSYAGNNNKALIQHRKKHIKEKTFKCQFCPKMFKTKQCLINHERRHRKSEEVKALQCQYCPKTFSMPYLLKIHEEAHQNERKYTCSYSQCSFKASNRVALSAHKHNCHKEKTLKCQFCPMMFAVKRTLKNHEDTHSNEKSFKCDICSETFKTADGKYRHRKKVHPEVVVKRNLAGVGIINQEENE